MRTSVLFFLIFINQFLQAQTSKVIRTLDFFNSVDIKGGIDVIFIPSEQFEVEVHADNPDDIITSVEGEKLLISNAKGKSLSWQELKALGKKQVVYIHSPVLTRINSFGSGNVTIDGIFKSDSLALSIMGSGNLSGHLNVERLELKSIGTGNIRLKGSVVKTEINSIGSGNVHCFELITDVCEVSSSGSGNIQITVNKKITGSTNGTGNVIYKGDPTYITVNSSGTGRLKKV